MNFTEYQELAARTLIDQRETLMSIYKEEFAKFGKENE